MEEKNSLKWFLIQKFMIVMLCIFISEQMLGYLYNNMLIPGISLLLVRQQISVTADGNPILFLLQVLLYILASFLPGGMDDYVQGLIGEEMAGSLQIAVDSPWFVGKWGILFRLMMIMMFLLLIFVSMLPYLVGAFYYYRMVTKRVNRMIEAEKQQRLAYDRKRNLLLSDIAHDVKTPITTLCSYSKALLDDMVQGAKKREYLEAIYNKSLRMNELITLLFEYVKLDSIGFELHKENGDLGEILRECVAALYADFEERKIALKIEIPEEPVPYYMDRVQMTRVITNILTNAVRYGREGGKTLVCLEEYVVTVADDGMEIDSEFAEHIFEPFSRADKARSTKGGSGLGLSIASKIVKMHSGELRLNCNYGHGYTKAFQILLKEGEEAFD